MMLCLALRSSPERVYQRALRQFSIEEISEVRGRPWAGVAVAAAPDAARPGP